RALLTIVAALALPATASAQTVSSPTVSESAGAARVAVTLVAARVDPVEIAWHTADATTLADAPLARAGVEYVPAAGVGRFEPGETVKEVLVTLLDDTVDEWSSFFAVVAGDVSGFVQITDDDPSPAPSIADAVVKENAGAVTLTVTRPFATELGPMRYAWTVKPGSATGEVVFAPAD